jgi:hypothetical protein
MAQQHINLGTPPAALDGDSARAAFQKVQANFTELYGAGGSAANSAALNGLSGAADKAPYFTGAGAMSLATLTAFARTLLDDADAAAARTTLGAQPLDATLTALANLTLAANQMIYATEADAVATTALTAFARTLLDDADAAAARTTLGLGTAATRAALGSTGSLYSMDSILGTVSQSGGVPTGAIIESGSNANGLYVRFANGTQICWRNRTSGTLGSGTYTARTEGALSFYYLVETWVFPSAFVDANIAFASSMRSVAPNNDVSTFCISNANGISSTQVGIYRVSLANTYTNVYLGMEFAVGRWF